MTAPVLFRLTEQSFRSLMSQGFLSPIWGLILGFSAVFRSGLKAPDLEGIARAMQRKVRKTPHTTLTEVAARAAKALRGAKLLPYPGVINPKRTRGAPRVVITAEANRIKIGVAGHGHQELMLYGAVERDTVVDPLVREFGMTNVTVRDPHGVWSAQQTV